jgi:hypothetical protein
LCGVLFRCAEEANAIKKNKTKSHCFIDSGYYTKVTQSAFLPVNSVLFYQSQPMEVHHHSHTSRKKWTHYFWEFLMLFLAVFCGFLAEYQLEHKIEKDKEWQYIIACWKTCMKILVHSLKPLTN